MKILITGANGFIAKNLIKGLSDHELTTITRADFDLIDKEAVDSFFANKYFDVVIHTAIQGGSRLKPDEDSSVFVNNMQMYYNLMSNEDSFGRFISFGSGAEIKPTTLYGLSKHFISLLMKYNPKCFNIRIFAVFGEDELDTRFIKSCIRRYLNRQPMEIHQNKLMDFFYIEDLVSMVKWVISVKELRIREMDCSYTDQLTLAHIATLVNGLDDYEVDIDIQEPELGDPYCGTCLPRPFRLVGLKNGITNVYNHMKNSSI